MRHTISILVENKFGVLARIAGMFSGRGFNIDTLNVGPTLDATASRMTIDVRGDNATALTKWTFVTATADKHPQLLLSGHYVDTLVRERGAWKFQRRLAYGDIPQGEPKTN